MSLRTGSTLADFRYNLSRLVSMGYSNIQAVSIAMKLLQKSCDIDGVMLPDLGEIVPPDWDDSPVEAPCCGAKLDPEIESKKADFPFRPTGIWGVFNYKR